jgi:hypothetical protein
MMYGIAWLDGSASTEGGEMTRRMTVLALLVCCVLLCILPITTADERGVGWSQAELGAAKFDHFIKEMHDQPHGSLAWKVVTRQYCVVAWDPEEREVPNVRPHPWAQPTTVRIVPFQVIWEGKTPLAGLWSARGEPAKSWDPVRERFVRLGGYFPGELVEKECPTKSRLKGAPGYAKLSYGTVVVRLYRPVAFHDIDGPVTAIVPVTDIDIVNWETVTPRVHEVEEGGVFAVDENGDLVLDGEGKPTYQVLPCIAVRLTSAVERIATQTVRFSYEVENLSPVGRTFSLPQVTTPDWPTGWACTVGACETVSTSVTVESQDVCTQNAQFDVEWSDDADHGSRMPVRVYVPRGRAEYDGSCEIEEIQYDGGLDVNRISVSVSGEDAEELAIFCEDGLGGLRLVYHEEGNFASGGTYTVHDDGYTSGTTNTYVAKVGRGVNGATSDASGIQN